MPPGRDRRSAVERDRFRGGQPQRYRRSAPRTSVRLSFRYRRRFLPSPGTAEAAGFGARRDIRPGGGPGFRIGAARRPSLISAFVAAGTPIDNWTLHDFRRSFSTSLHERFGCRRISSKFVSPMSAATKPVPQANTTKRSIWTNAAARSSVGPTIADCPAR